MDRKTRLKSAPWHVGGLCLALCLGCSRAPSSSHLDASSPGRISTNDKGGTSGSSKPAQSRNDISAPGLLTDSEVATAAPLQPPAETCDYRTAAPPQSAASLLRNPGPAPSNPGPSGATAPSYSYAPEYDETKVWKGTQSGPPATVSEAEAFRAHPWLSGVVGPPSASVQPWTAATVVEPRPLPAPAPIAPPRPATSNVVPTTPNSPAAAVSTNEGPSSPLPWAKLKAAGTELDTARRQADETLRRAFALAERGALFSAQSEFIHALRDLAEALDAAQDTALHMQALSSGLRAVQEADDFQPKGARIETQLPLSVLIASHQTPVLKSSAAGVTPSQAKQLYQAYAQEQLAVALGTEPIGSLALFALAKTQSAIDAKKPSDSGAALARAITYHRAALMVEPGNFLAANDLGVLLARQGRWEEARAALEQSIAISPQSAAWRNLAIVQQNMKQTELARQSQQQAESLAQRQAGSARGALAVQWLDAANFAQTSSGAIDTSAPANANQPARVAQAPNAPGNKGSGATASTTRN